MSRKWQVAGGKWQVAGGKWQVAGGKWQVANLRLPFAVFCILSSVFLLVLPARAQLPPPEVPSGPVEPVVLPDPSLPPVQDSAAPAPEKENPEEWEQKLLRDPFWPVGFFPPNWQQRSEAQTGGDLGSSGWKAAANKLQISGTSRLGDRTAAIINGELKGEGEKIEVLYDGRIYQWEIIGIDAAGQVQLKKLGVR